MGTGYTRNDTGNNIADGNVINASDLDGEFDAVQAAFNAATGHSHDGTTGEGPQIQTAGLADDAVTGDKIDSTTTVTAASFVGPLTGNVSGNVTGNASTATALQTARTIAGQSFDGTANINIAPTDLTGVTASAAELNIMDGVTATTAEINKLDGVTATTAELNYTDGVTSNIQTQLNAKVAKSGDTLTGDLVFSDSIKAKFGASDDLIILHDNSSSQNTVQSSASNGLHIGTTDGLYLKSSTFGETLATFFENGAVNLYYNNSAKLATTNTGVDVTGEITTDGLTTSADINFGDSDKAIFGAGSDLQIFHDGSNSYIRDSGTGSLYIDATHLNLRNGGQTGTYADFTNGGAARFMYNSSVKLATTSTGIDVTGEITADGIALGDNQKATFGASDDLEIYHNGSHSYIKDAGTGSLRVLIDDFNLRDSADSQNMMRAFNDGAVELYHDGDQKLSTVSTGVSVTGRAVGTETTDNDLSMDLQASNYFKCTPSGNGTLTFTNATAGQSGMIWFNNSGGHTISAAASTYISSADLTAISTAGAYLLSYYSEGSVVIVSASAAVTSAGA